MKKISSTISGAKHMRALLLRVFTAALLVLSTVVSPAFSETLDELYEKAKKEGGQLTAYIAMSSRSAEFIFPAFKKRFPAVNVNHVDATTDKLVARVMTEARGGRVVGDVFGGALPYVAQMADQKLLVPLNAPEAAVYPANAKSTEWVGTDAQFFIIGWNTNLVKKGDEPKGFEDLTDPKWKNNIMGEPRDFQLLMGLAKHKYKSDEKAMDLLKKIAAHGVEFHKGHSQIAELLVAGQRPLCFTCFSHHFPPRMKRGAPIRSLLTEGVGEIGGSVAILKGAPHPNTALLYARWAISEEGQRVFAEAGETPLHPRVEPKEQTRPDNIYMLTLDDVKEFTKYEKLWKQIFSLR